MGRYRYRHTGTHKQGIKINRSTRVGGSRTRKKTVYSILYTERLFYRNCTLENRKNLIFFFINS